MIPLTPALKLIIILAVIVPVLVSYVRREEAIGGWLLVFFSLMYVRVAVLLLFSIPIIAKAFPASPFTARPASDLAAIIVLLRLAANAIVATASTFLLRERDSLWLGRLRLALGAGLFLEGIALAMDFLYFPNAIVRNLFGWFVLPAWLIYFFVSVRVRMVFLSKTWGETPVDRIFTEG